MAARLNLGGRDSLILAGFMANEVQLLYSHDDTLTRLVRVSWKNSTIRIEDPLREWTAQHDPRRVPVYVPAWP